MEVYRYSTGSEYQRILRTGSLTAIPREGVGKRPIYTLPYDPLLWGVVNTRDILKWIRSISGENATTLIKFDIDIFDRSTPIWVQEGCVDLWFKKDKRQHISMYKREDYESPEVLVYQLIPSEHITIVEFPKELIECT